MNEPTLSAVLHRYLEQRGFSASHHHKRVCEQAGLDDQTIAKILTGTARVRPQRGTLVKLADALRLSAEDRHQLKVVAGYGDVRGYLDAHYAERLTSPRGETRPDEQHDGMSLRRGVLLLRAPKDPLDLIYRLGRSKPWTGTAVRVGSVFGEYDIVVRVTTPKGLTILDYADLLFAEGNIRTIETIPLRDDLPIYVDRYFSNQHLKATDYAWATTFVLALGGERDVPFPQIFYEVAERPEFWGGIHLLTAAITVGQYDSVIEVLAAKPSILKLFLRAAQDYAHRKYRRELHTVTHLATELKPRRATCAF